jgi:hypothetical protein
MIFQILSLLIVQPKSSRRATDSQRLEAPGKINQRALSALLFLPISMGFSMPNFALVLLMTNMAIER